MYELQTSVEVNGVEYRITNEGDYRMVLDCFNVLNDEELNDYERMIACAIIFFVDFDSMDDLARLSSEEYTDLINGMMLFFNCGENKSSGMTSQYKLIDWEQDSQLIISAINNVSGKEIRAERYIHWWTFMAYYMAIGDCPLSNIVSIRHKIAKGKKLEKYESEFRRDNPQYFQWNAVSVQQKADDELLRQIWNNGEGD